MSGSNQSNSTTTEKHVIIVPLHIGFSSEGQPELKRICVARANRDDV